MTRGLWRSTCRTSGVPVRSGDLMRAYRLGRAHGLRGVQPDSPITFDGDQMQTHNLWRRTQLHFKNGVADGYKRFLLLPVKLEVQP